MLLTAKGCIWLPGYWLLPQQGPRQVGCLSSWFLATLFSLFAVPEGSLTTGIISHSLVAIWALVALGVLWGLRHWQRFNAELSRAVNCDLAGKLHMIQPQQCLAGRSRPSSHSVQRVAKVDGCKVTPSGGSLFPRDLRIIVAITDEILGS